MGMTHGGDWAGYEQEYGTLPLDFSASLSPLGLPEGVRLAAAEALDAADRYPDPLCRKLRRGLAERHRIPEERIVCGNGAADLLYRLVLAERPERGLVTMPTFSEYENALRTVGCACERVPLDAAADFAVTEGLLSHVTPGLDVLFLCEPNNPTGRTTEPDLLERILTACAEAGTLLVVDECFVDFLDEPEAHTLAGRLDGYPNLVILRAFTKWYAMAGLRLGYALCGSEDVAERLRSCGQPWAVSAVAQAAGLAALREREYDERLRRLIRDQRARLAAGLAALGCRVMPGEANFLLFYHADRVLCRKLRERGILLRDCATFTGLEPGWYRAAVRTGPENEIFLRTLGEVLADG